MSRYNQCYNKLAKYANNPGTIHFRAIIRLIRFGDVNSNEGIKFHQNLYTT